MSRVDKAAQQLGKKGGESTLRKYGKEHYKNIGRLGGKKGRGKSKSKKKTMYDETPQDEVARQNFEAVEECRLQGEQEDAESND